MNRKRRDILIFVVLIIGVACAMFLHWKKGKPYQEPVWSPNKQYRVQKYQVKSLSSFVPLMPGQGGDAINGYVRLYDSQGMLLHERYVVFMRDIKPIWDHNKVYLQGVSDMDDHPWVLPSSAD